MHPTNPLSNYCDLAANNGKATIIAVESAPHQDSAARKKFVELSKLNTMRLPRRALKDGSGEDSNGQYRNGS